MLTEFIRSSGLSLAELVVLLVATIGAAASIWAAVISGRSARRAAAESGKATTTAAGIGAAATEAVANINARAQAVAAEIAAEAQLVSTDKTVFVSTVTAERSTWRVNLRSASVCLVALLRSSGGGAKIDWKELYSKRTEIALRLNPLGRSSDQSERDAHPLDRDIQMILDEIWVLRRRPSPTHTDLALRLEIAVQKLLKQEWTVSKREAQTGRLA